MGGLHMPGIVYSLMCPFGCRVYPTIDVSLALYGWLSS